MATWETFEREAPELAALGRERLERLGVAVIGTTRRDGAPRVSATEPYLVDGELYLGMMWRSTKALDLLRDPRLVVHSPICDREAGYDEGEFKVRGRAVDVSDQATREKVADVIEKAIDWRPTEPYHLFSVDIESAAFIYYDNERKHVTLWRPGAGVEKREGSG